MTTYKLPDLPYDFGALEPHISGQILELHHGRHHKAYVTGANQNMEKLQEARHKNDFAAIGWLERALAFNVSGHILHAIYWQNMKKDGGGEPSGDLASAITRDFGSFATFKSQMNKAAMVTMGSGWAALVFDPATRRLGTTLIHDHQNDLTQAGVPLLVIDAWEHAFYLQYKADKDKYFEAIWNTWNWDDVATRFANAQKLDLGLRGAVEG